MRVSDCPPRAVTAATVLFLVLGPGAPALANPQGPQVAHGAAVVTVPDAKTLEIANTPNAIINWKSFSIAADETTRFVQQSAASAVLNRVVGQDPSQLLGQLQSNGRVFLINPNGLVFGAGAVVDTAGFVGSTLGITDADFLAGRLDFEAGPDAGDIENHGFIKASGDGGVYLVAPQVENDGIIRTEQGDLLLAAGRKLTISSLDLDHISFELRAPDDEAINLGTLLTSGGAAGMFASSVTNRGVIRAQGLSVDAGGRIRLTATGPVRHAAGATLDASGAIGGDVRIESEAGDALVEGAVQARGEAGEGGQVRVLGDRVGLFGAAEIDTSGRTGGGEVLVGGDFQGKNPDVRNARATVVAPDAIIRADATGAGDGGRVIVWADGFTQGYGTISARGGPSGGDGGFVEVSGKGGLAFDARVDNSAPLGRIGTLLLDPPDINIVSAGTPFSSVDINSNNGIEFVESTAGVSISSASLDSQNASIELQASQDVNFNDAVTLNTAGAGLTVRAGRNVIVSNPISTTGGVVSLFADDAGGPASGTGKVAVSANIDTTANAAAGADILIASTGVPGGGNAVEIIGGGTTLTAGAGKVSLKADNHNVDVQGPVSGASVSIQSGGTTALAGAVSATAGDVNLNSTGAATISANVTASNAAFLTVSGAGNLLSVSAGANVQSGTFDTVLQADEIDVSAAGTISSTGNNLVVFQPHDKSRAISVGAVGDGGADLDVSQAELNKVTAGQLSVGNPSLTGQLAVDAAVSYTGGASVFELLAPNGVTLNAALTSAVNLRVIASNGAFSATGGNLTSSGGGLVVSAGSVLVQGRDVVAANDASISGGSVTVQGNAGSSAKIQSQTGSLSVGAGTVNVLGGAGSLESAKLDASQVLTIGGGNVNVIGGAGPGSGASLDPTEVKIDISGDLQLFGGAGAGSDAQIQASGPVTIRANDVFFRGGTGPSPSRAFISASPGPIAISTDGLPGAVGTIGFQGGTVANADAFVDANAGTGVVALRFGQCIGCAAFALNPFGSPATEAGVFLNGGQLILIRLGGAAVDPLQGILGSGADSQRTLSWRVTKDVEEDERSAETRERKKREGRALMCLKM